MRSTNEGSTYSVWNICILNFFHDLILLIRNSYLAYVLHLKRCTFTRLHEL